MTFLKKFNFLETSNISSSKELEIFSEASKNILLLLQCEKQGKEDQNVLKKKKNKYLQYSKRKII